MSKFKDNVLKAVNMVPKGKVVSYGQVALMVGIPRAAIQVGWVLHQSGDKVPWWRVINKKGHISTTCLEHDANMQKLLLEKEGVRVSETLEVDMSIYRFNPDANFLDELNLDDEYIQMLIDRYGV
jgi:methylated-DNA-protein-cysteine methyltransferase related protein